MSALSYLGDYGSNSEESDSSDLDNSHRPRVKLPAPNLSKVLVVPSEHHEDNPLLHGGRTRTFAHVRGNWATFVYVPYLDLEILHGLLDKLQEQVFLKVGLCEKIEDFHVSLSKTVVLKYHLISSFSSSIQSILKTVECFDLGFAGVKVYCNEDKSRTFVSLDVDPFTHKFLWAISKKVDQVLEEYQLPTFYEDPSFHMSILWVNGDKKAELDSIVELMNEILFQETEKFLKPTLIELIHCKIGNKLFKYTLT